MSNLTKAEKKLCRELIQKALQKKCGEFIDKTKLYLASADGLPHNQYLELYKMVCNFDKRVAWRYDDITGSRYLPTVACLYAEGHLSKDDIVGFGDEARDYIERMANF